MAQLLRRGWFPLLALLVLAFNLRPVAVSVGPVLVEITRDANLGPIEAGLLTSLPTLSFAVFGAVAPGLARRFGDHAVIAASLVALIAGQLLRAATTTPWAFLGFSTLALAGMALANVLLPGLVRLHFPNRVGLVTALYSFVLTIGVTLAGAVTVPMAEALGGWRAAFTAGASIAVAALITWLPLWFTVRRRPQHSKQNAAHTMAAVARTKLGWAMALFFGIQSAQAYSIFGWLPSVYRSAGLSSVDAGYMLGLATGIGIIPALLIPAYVARAKRPQLLLLALVAFLVIGYCGLLINPAQLSWLWATLLALGTAMFPMILALLGIRARTPSATAALSGFTQSVGYLIAVAGPLSFGTLQAWTGSWTASLVLQLVLIIPQTGFGLYALRDQVIEDQLAS